MITDAELDAIKREAQRVARLVIGPDDISPTTQLRLIREVEELRAGLHDVKTKAQDGIVDFGGNHKADVARFMAISGIARAALDENQHPRICPACGSDVMLAYAGLRPCLNPTSAAKPSGCLLAT